MTEKATYVCDYCGQEFESEEDCIIHEKEERFKEFDGRVIFFDSANEPFPSRPDRKDLAKTYAVWTADEEAFDFVNELFSDEEYETMYDLRAEMNKGPNIFYYSDADNGTWRCLDYDLKKLLDMKKNIEEALDK